MNTVAQLEQQIGIPGLFTQGLYDKYGPQWAGRKLLQVIWENKPETIRDVTFDLRDLPFSDAGQALLWRRELISEMIGWWVHHADKNVQYLSANRGMYTGIGDPIHQQDEEVTPHLPGIYRVTWNTAHSVFDGLLYPFIIEPDQEWITLDMLKFATKQGYCIQVHEAWVFPQKTRVLDEWAARIWQALVALKELDRVAYEKCKAIYRASNGAWNWNKVDRPGLMFIHPNWWADTVSKARVALLANLLHYGAPVCIRTDGLYFISQEPDIRLALPGMFDRENESGGYKIPGGWRSFQLDQTVIDQARGLDDGELSTLFKQYGGMKA